MKKKIWLYLILPVLYAIPFVAFFLFIWKGDINGQFYDETTSNNVTVVIDTTEVNAPVVTSERFLGFDTVRLERADKRANYGENAIITDMGGKRVSQKSELKSELKSEPERRKTVFGDAEERITSDTASYRQVSSPMNHFGDTNNMVYEDHFEDMSGMVTDSMEVLLPRVQRRYEDSTCTVWVSGHDPKVDSVWVYNRRVYYPVGREKKAKPPNVVVSVGPYVGFGNRGFNYGLAVTVGVPIWSW